MDSDVTFGVHDVQVTANIVTRQVGPLLSNGSAEYRKHKRLLNFALPAFDLFHLYSQFTPKPPPNQQFHSFLAAASWKQS
jgi:hypothetical protein